MAIRLKSKWHRSRRSRNQARAGQPKTLADLSGVISFNVWKISHEVFRRMEKEGFRFAEDMQVVRTLQEFIAFLVHMIDRRAYGHWDDDKRHDFINRVCSQLTDNMVENQTELLGPGDYAPAMTALLNARFTDYAECAFDDNGPGFEARRFLALQIADILAQTDNRWVIEQVMDIEVPYALDMVLRLATDALGLKTRQDSPPVSGAPA